MFLGRKSYELMLTMGDNEIPGMPNLTEYVFSNTLKEVKPGAILISGNIETVVKQIKDKQGKNIWLFGGASLTASLMNLGLVDEISLAVHPIILGSGKPLFNNVKGRIALTLTDTKTYSTGLVSLSYRVGL